MKISEKIKKINSKTDSPGSSPRMGEKKTSYYSFEYFPPKTQSGVENLVDRIERMGRTNPLWIDVTWNAGGVTSDITLDLCSHIQQYCGLDVLMHITCTYMTRDQVKENLNRARELGIKNLLALRGDPPRGATDWVATENGFNYAIDLVKFIREEYGDFFCIGVAGYPEVHLQATSREDDIYHLKEKVDAGADFVITQLFYDNQIFYDWVADCRRAGIECEIIPGIMPILGYDRFHRMCKFTKTMVPPHILESLEEIKGDDEAVQAFGVQYGVTQTNDLIKKGFRFIHYYTMNLESSVLKILDGNDTLNNQRHLPFRKMTSSDRMNEQIRPIFWANTPKSYVA